MPVADPPIPAAGAVAAPAGERAARQALRLQIARLERDLADVATCAHPRLAVPPVPGRGGPRLLSLGELEAVRDELAARLHDVRDERVRLAERQAAARLRLERMLVDPRRHKWVRVSNKDLGEPGCGHWHVRPRLGLIGMLAGWWHVTVSSGCPLPRGSRPWLRPRLG